MIISKTPLRVSFFGGGSDLADCYRQGKGAVLSTSIDKYLYVMVNKKFDPYIRISYSETEIVHDIADIKHHIIRECLKFVGGVNEGIDISYMADVQPYNYGTGLGVSSSIAVGVLHALYAYKGITVTQQQLAEEACHIEIEVLKEPIGKQDQYAVALGGLNKLEFNADETVTATPIHINTNILNELQDCLYLVHTGLSSDSKSVLTEQKKNTAQNLSVLAEMVNLVDVNKALLTSGELTSFGQNLHKTWLKKKSLSSNITSSHIDSIYKLGLESGALGGKVLGSGGGGFILFYCPLKDKSQFLKSMGGYRSLKVNFESKGSQIVFQDYRG
jgi:D-glycero-alpha-D-manno-heptose-7-phosphate kinase